ncbi:MAG: phosphoglycolate phosphatase [Polaromonas sp.]|nr:phosphoglycolate phosphatase [Polaromonas sp.]
MTPSSVSSKSNATSRPDLSALRLTSFDAAIVDLDGTLIDTLGDFVGALDLMCRDLQLRGDPPLDKHLVGQMVGKGSEHLINSVLNHLLPQYCQGVSATNRVAIMPNHPMFAPAFAAYQTHYLAVNGHHSVVYPGVPKGLQILQHAGLKLACVTNKPVAFARPLLRLKALDAYFSHVFGGDSFPRKKPDPLPLIKTCEALGTLPARTLMVGDSANDALAARAAGCPVVLVTYGYNHGEPARGVDADWHVDSLADLAKLSDGKH